MANKDKELNLRLAKLTEGFQSGEMSLIRYLHDVACTLKEPSDARTQTELANDVDQEEEEETGRSHY